MKVGLKPRLARRWSLRTKVIAWSFVPTAIILIIVAWAIFDAYQRLTEDLVIERDQELTHLIAGELARGLIQEAESYRRPADSAELLSLVARLEAMVQDPLAQSEVFELVSNIVKPRIGESGSAYLVDGNGRIIYHSNIRYIGKNVSAQPAVQQALNGKTGALRTHDTADQEIVASFAPVPGTGWGLITEESWQGLIRSSQRYRESLLFLLVLVVVTPTLVIITGVRRITRPIEELTRAAQEVAGGNFDQTITAATGDELEELALQFNRMAAQLQESYSNLERKVADRTKELAALNAIAASANDSLNLDQTLNRALDEMLNLLELEVGEIRLLDQKKNELTILTQRGLSSTFVRTADRQVVAETLPGRVLLTDEPVIFEDVNHALQHTWVRQEGLRAIAIFPLKAKEKRLGILSLATRRGPRPFSSNERRLLRAVSDQVGVAIENAQLFEIEQRRAEQFQVISEVGRRIASILAVDELLEEIVRLVKETLGYYLVGIGLVEEGEIIIKAGAGQLWEILDPQPVRLKIGAEGIVGWVAQSGEPLLVPDVSQELRYRPLPADNETRSELAIPLKTKDAIIGVLDVQSDRPNAFDELDLAVLQSLAQQAAIAIENARLYQQAQQLAVMEERDRLARDLHDSVTQALYGVTLLAAATGRRLIAGDTQAAIQHLQELQHTAQEALGEMRLLIFELRPPILGKNGLAAALQNRLEAVEARAGLESTFNIQGAERRLPAEIEGGLYRIAQEALNNTLKHAHARHITVSLCQNKPLIVLEVADDGVGFDPLAAQQQGGLGLQSMQERAVQLGARLSVQSQPGAGTQVRVEVTQCPPPSGS